MRAEDPGATPLTCASACGGIFRGAAGPGRRIAATPRAGDGRNQEWAGGRMVGPAGTRDPSQVRRALQTLTIPRGGPRETSKTDWAHGGRNAGLRRRPAVGPLPKPLRRPASGPRLQPGPYAATKRAERRNSGPQRRQTVRPRRVPDRYCEAPKGERPGPRGVPPAHPDAR